jgi:hypothetical protein
MNDRAERRVGRNQSLFRETNDAIERGLWPGEERGPVRFRCECAALDCQGVVGLPLAEYETIRSNPRRFVVLPGHDQPEVETVVEQFDGYTIVEKYGVAAREAETEDPRGDGEPGHEDEAGDQA